MPAFVYYILAAIGLMLLIHIGMRIERVIHWMMRKRGVTEVTSRQNRQFAKKYKVRAGDKPTNRLKKRKSGRDF